MGRGRELKDSPLGATFTHHGWDKRLYGTSATIQPATQQRPTSAECSLSSSADLTITLSSQTAKLDTNSSMTVNPAADDQLHNLPLNLRDSTLGPGLENSIIIHYARQRKS
ncbi:unnamed protein product [Boreogadus saida]